MLNRTKVKYCGRSGVLAIMAYWASPVLAFLFFLLGPGYLGAAPRMHRICVSPDGTNTLQWFTFKDTCDDLVRVEVYGRENSFSPFKLIGDAFSPKSTEYAHAGAVAFQKGYYFLRYEISCGGNAVSVYSDTLQVDYRAPEIIDPDSVSIVNGKVVIGWSPAKEPDAKSYVIYRTVGSNNFPIDTVYGKFNTLYTDSIAGEPGTKAERYKIAPMDSCDNIAPIGQFHQTVFLQVSADNCRGELYLTWSPYIGWAEGVDSYDIYIKDSTGYRKVGSTAGLIDTLAGLKTKVTYSIYVRANKKGGGATSSSNLIIHKADFGDVLDYLYISSVTYLDERLQVNWLVADHPELARFELWRGRDKLRMIKAGDIPPDRFSWEDNNPGDTVWFFKLRAFNTCGNMLAESNISNSIVLHIGKDTGYRNLEWNEYAQWLNGVEGYEVYKRVYGDEEPGLLPIGVTDEGTTVFTDTAPLAEDTLPGACYYIVANEDGVNKYGVRGSSISNKVCYRNPPIVHIPDAFVPHEHVNTHFRPSLLNVEISRSSLEIYNRWGQRVAENIDLNIGWDGMLSNGNVAPEGVYFYILTVQGIDGSTQFFRGPVTLL